MNILLDTNILARTAQANHPQHQAAGQAMALLVGQGETLCLLPQNLYEFWVVCTRPADQNGLGLSVPEAHAELLRVKGQFSIFVDTPTILATWEHLVVKYQVAGKTAHDARLVAGMIVHGIPRLLTFNKADFERYQEIAVLTPDEVITSGAASKPGP